MDGRPASHEWERGAPARVAMPQAGGARPHDPVWLLASNSADVSRLAIPTHPVLERTLSRVPINVRQTFTSEQLAALARASVEVAYRHPLDYRVSFGVFGRRYYLTVLGGRERRSRERLLREGQTVLSRLTLAYSVLTVAFGVGLVLFGFIALYVVKSLLGIDLIQDYSLVGDLMRDFR